MADWELLHHLGSFCGDLGFPLEEVTRWHYRVGYQLQMWSFLGCKINFASHKLSHILLSLLLLTDVVWGFVVFLVFFFT